MDPHLSIHSNPVEKEKQGEWNTFFYFCAIKTYGMIQRIVALMRLMTRVGVRPHMIVIQKSLRKRSLLCVLLKPVTHRHHKLFSDVTVSMTLSSQHLFNLIMTRRPPTQTCTDPLLLPGTLE